MAFGNYFFNPVINNLAAVDLDDGGNIELSTIIIYGVELSDESEGIDDDDDGTHSDISMRWIIEYGWCEGVGEW